MDLVDEVKQRLSIEDVISEYVQLKRAGRNWKGLSPFTVERTPSFMVSPDKQIWHDFSSGRGGDMISFVMEAEGLDFRGALEHLARKAGLDPAQFQRARGARSGPNKERLLAVLDAATHFYQVQFSKNNTALEYVFKKRQFDKETALEWRLGYSPNTGTALLAYLRGKKFTDAEITGAGLTAQRRGGLQDMFRGRLMIPLADAQGNIIGFTARLLADNPDAPKYINTPQTPLYDKSRHVFGLHLAKQQIRREGYAVIAEGNLDVISSHQAGVRQVVATAGTALTEPHLKALSRFTGDIRLSFDADKAGMNATERAIPIASKAKVSLSIITIPSGKDPDELIKQDPALWEQAITQNQYALDWLIERYRAQLNVTSAEGKRQFSDVLLPVVRALDDAVERDHYLTKIAEVIGVSREALDEKFTQTAGSQMTPKPKRIKTQPVVPDKLLLEQQRLEDRLLAVTLMQPATRPALDNITAEMFTRAQAQELFGFLETHADFTGQAEKLGELKNIADYVKIQSVLYDELYQGLEVTELQYEAARLQARLVEQFVKAEKSKLAAQLPDADAAESVVLLTRARELDTLLRTTGGIHGTE